MLIDLCKVAPGELPDAVFDELVAGNTYSPDMVAALRDHLVNGHSIKVAAKAHGAIPHKLNMRLEKLNEEIQRTGRIMALLTKRAADDLIALEEARELSKTLTQKLEALGRGRV